MKFESMSIVVRLLLASLCAHFLGTDLRINPTYIFLAVATPSLIDDRLLFERARGFFKRAVAQRDSRFNILKGFTRIGPH